MRVTFRNVSESSPIKLYIDNRTFTLGPQCCADFYFSDGTARFTAETLPADLLKELEDEEEPKNLKDRITDKLLKKFARKLPEMGLYTAVTYVLTSDRSDVTVEINESAYSVFDGEVAYYFSMIPMIYSFPQAETTLGTLKVLKAHSPNRKKYMRLIRNLLLFFDWGLFLPNLCFFIPKYIFSRFCASDLYITCLIGGLYRLSPEKRGMKIASKPPDGNHHSRCGRYVFILVVIALIVAVCIWGVFAEPEVIIDEQFQSVVCFDELFIRTDGELPQDAKKTFLEDYYAYYPTDGGYDSDSYYCYIYEDSQGNRYMLLHDNTENNNDMLFVSVGEQKKE